MFCIKCGMMLDNSAKSCPACGTKMVFPEGFTPDDSPSPAPKAQVILSNEPPHAPDDFDLSKANITYNGKTMLINDEPEIDLDMTMAAPSPRAPQAAPAPAQPTYQQPVYAAPSSYIPSPVPTAQEEETVENEAPKSKSKLPVIIGISVVVLIAAIIAIVAVIAKGGDEKKNDVPDAPTVSSVGKTENASVTAPNLDADTEPEVILVEYNYPPSDDLVYIVREKDMTTVVLNDAKIGYFEGDALAAEYAASNEKEAKEFVLFKKIEELKEALEKGDINIILISEELSEEIISKKEDSSDIDNPNPDHSDNGDFEPLEGSAEQQTSDNYSENEGNDTATTEPDIATSEATPDTEVTAPPKPPAETAEN